MRKAAFDEVAPDYDDRFSNQPITQHLRRHIHAKATAYLPPQARILEVGCGTGVDAAHFAAQGHFVMATDPSSEMLQVARNRTAPDHGQFAIWNADVPPPQVLARYSPYDMVFSNFGAVNCISDLGAFANRIAPLMRPNAVVFIVVINRWCLSELVLNLALMNRKNLTRRWRKHTTATLEDGTKLALHLPSVKDLTEAFSPHFKLQMTAPIGVFLPPSELYQSYQKRPKLVRMAYWLDQRLGPVWPFSKLGDHSLFVFQRTETRPAAT